MDYQRLISAGKVNGEQEHNAKELLKNVQRVLKPIRVINPYAEFLELPKSVFKPRRTNSHYLQFIEAITFYKQYQREKKYDEQTGEEFIETEIEDIQEANEIRRRLRIKETTLRRYNAQLLAENYIQRVKVKSKSYCFEIVDLGEYTHLKKQIDKALQDCIDRIKGTK